VLYVRAFRRHDAAPAHARWFTFVGLALHVATLAGMVVVGLHPGFSEFVSAVALALMVITALVRGRMTSLGTFLSPIAVGLLAIALAAPSAHVVTLDQVEGSWFLPVHIGLMLAAVVGFFVEFTAGLVQGIVRRRLKRKDLTALGRFPALDVLDRVQFRALVFGLAALALGIAAGGMWAASTMHHRDWIADPKVWSTLVVWIWYAVVLQVRLSLGWHGRSSMFLSTIGFVALLVSFLGLDFVIGGFHAYGG
jgi:ABC-type uncharacterized transport system permease subunit